MQEQTSSNNLGENVPRLRFSGFEEEWVCERLSDFTERVTRKNTNNKVKLPLTISSKAGLVDQISYFNKTVASIDMSGYYLLKNGEYAYNKSYSVGYAFGSIKRLDQYSIGALSTLYICFSLKKHNSDFIKIYFDSLKWYHEINIIAAEGARNHGLLNIPTEDFFRTKHWLPININEQKKIAKFFNLLEYRIELQQKMLEALKLYKRGALSKLFPQKGEIVPRYRFNGFTDDWKQRKLGEVCNYYSSNLSVSDIDKNGKFELYDANGVIGKTNRLLQKEEYITIIKDGNGVGRVRKTHKNSSFIGTMGAIVPNGLDINYLFVEFQRKDFSKHINGATIPHIYFSNYSEDILCVPEFSEQQQIGEYFRNLDCLITLHQSTLNSFKTIKNGLLQNLFI